jgi:hypothetical protein
MLCSLGGWIDKENVADGVQQVAFDVHLGSEHGEGVLIMSDCDTVVTCDQGGKNPPFPVRCRTSSRERVESVRAHPHMIISDGKRGQVIHVHAAARALFRSDLRCSYGRGSRMAP